MAQRKKAPRSKSKKRSKARPTSSRSRASFTDPECLGADVDALVTQRMIVVAKRQLGTVPQFWGRYFKGPGDQNSVRYQASLRARFSGQTTFVYCRLRSRPITLTAMDLWVLRMACATQQPLLLHLAGLICQPWQAFLFFSMLKVRQGNRSTRSIIEDGAMP